MRVASSFRRARDRTSTRLATFTQPINSTNSAPPHSRYRVERTSRTRSSCQQRGHGVQAGRFDHLFRLGDALQVGRAERIDLRLRLRERGIARQASEIRPVVRVALCLLLIGEGEGQPRLHLRIDQREVGRHHADDAVRLAVDAQVASNCIGIAEEPLAQPVAQDDDMILPQLTFVVGEGAPDPRRHADQAEERRRDLHGVDALGCAVQVEAWIAHVEERLLVEHRQLASALEVIHHAGGGVLRPRLGETVIDEHDAVRFGHAQRPQQDVVDDREERHIGAETDRKRERGGHGEGLVLPEEPGADAQIVHEQR